MAETRAELHQRLEHDLTLHPPQNEEVIRRFELLRAAAKEYGHLVIDLCPIGRDLSMFITHMEDASQAAIAAIARNQDSLPETTR